MDGLQVAEVVAPEVRSLPKEDGFAAGCQAGFGAGQLGWIRDAEPVAQDPAAGVDVGVVGRHAAGFRLGGAGFGFAVAGDDIERSLLVGGRVNVAARVSGAEFDVLGGELFEGC